MTMKEFKTDPHPPSELFVDVIYGASGVGSDEMECGWCGRQHFCPDNEYIERDGLDRVEYKAYCEEELRNNPSGVVLNYDCDSVSGRELNGMLFVIGCPCNGLARFEKFIWAERNIIRKYLRQRIDSEFELAEQERTKNILAGIDKKDPKTEWHWLYDNEF